MKPYSVDLRQKILQTYQQGEGSYGQIAKRFRVSLSFLKRLMGRYQREKTLKPRPLGRQKPGVLAGYEQKIREYLEESNDLTLQELTDQLARETGICVSVPTMCRFLKTHKLTRKKKQPTILKLKLKPYNSCEESIGSKSETLM